MNIDRLTFTINKTLLQNPSHPRYYKHYKSDKSKIDDNHVKNKIHLQKSTARRDSSAAVDTGSVTRGSRSDHCSPRHRGSGARTAPHQQLTAAPTTARRGIGGVAHEDSSPLAAHHSSGHHRAKQQRRQRPLHSSPQLSATATQGFAPHTAWRSASEEQCGVAQGERRRGPCPTTACDTARIADDADKIGERR